MRPSRSRSTGTISRRARPLTNTTKRKPNFSSYAPVQLGELGEHGRVVVGALLAAERADVGLPPIAGCASSTSFFSPSGSAARDLARAAERIVERGQPLDEARASFEQLRELLGAQLPR